MYSIRLFGLPNRIYWPPFQISFESNLFFRPDNQHAFWHQLPIQHREFLQAGQPLQLRDAAGALLRAGGREALRGLEQGGLKHPVLPQRAAGRGWQLLLHAHLHSELPSRQRHGVPGPLLPLLVQVKKGVPDRAFHHNFRSLKFVKLTFLNCINVVGWQIFRLINCERVGRFSCMI